MFKGHFWGRVVARIKWNVEFDGIMEIPIE